jgi:UTP-glucose-1-phosphate uridylyltransferase
MSELALLVMAAGMGSRYGGLKQMEPVGPGDETIIDYSVYDALRAGFTKLVFVIRRDIEADFRLGVGRRFEHLLPVQYVFQELDHLPAGFAPFPNRKKPWGTGHAILMAADAISSPFAVINADDFYGRDSFAILAAHLRQEHPSYAMAGFILRNTLSEFGAVARGVCSEDAGGFLAGVTELTKITRAGEGAVNTDSSGRPRALSGGEIVSMNMWGFTPGIFSHLRREMGEFLRREGQDEKAEFYIPAVVNDLIRRGQERVKVLRTPESWFGVTYREDRPRVIEGLRQRIEAGVYPERLW